jgi:hypothetical protein
MRKGSTRAAALLSAVLLTTTLVTTTPLAGATAAAQARPVSPSDRAAVDAAIAAGLRVLPDAPAGSLQFDPALALLPAETRGRVNLAQAAVNRSAAGRQRAATRRAAALAPARTYAEKEAAGVIGTNDTVPTGERITGFGTGAGRTPAVTVTGDLAPDLTIPVIAAPEDNGSIPLAVDTGVTALRSIVTVTGSIGDGPHGSAGDATGDVDFYKVSGIPAGAPLTMRIASQGTLNAVVRIFDAAGNGFLYIDDPTSSDVSFSLPMTGAGDFYAMVSGFGASFPADVNDPASGSGAGSEGGYTATISVDATGDTDVYTVDAKAGDVLGATVTGQAAHLSFLDAGGRELMGSPVDASGSYAPASPLPGGGNATVDLVAPRAGRYSLAVSGGTGAYRVTLEAYRPGTETDAKGTVQTLFLDFDGARVNTSIFGGGGAQRTLSPLSAYLPGWGLTAADEDDLIDAVVASVTESISRDLARKGTNPRFAVRILNSRDHADPFGRPDVSRLVVGGSIAESGISTIGIAQSIDPGNFGHEETAIILLDLLSAPVPNPNSLATYMSPASDRIGFVGRALGNIIVHEAGHYSGNWHTNQYNTVANLMDQGGNIAQMIGVGSDGVGGTADDTDVDLVTDDLDGTEVFSGAQDALNRTAWAYATGRG